MEFPDSPAPLHTGKALQDPVCVKNPAGAKETYPRRDLRCQRAVEQVRHDIGGSPPVLSNPVSKARHCRKAGLCAERPRREQVPFRHIQILLPISI
jgi:hypothetical protein